MTRIAFWLAQYQLKSKKPALRLRALQRLRTAINNAVVALDGKITIALLDHVLADPEPEVRREAAAILGDLCDARTLPPLLRALNDRTEAVQEIAIQGIRKLEDRRAVDALVSKLFHGTSTIQWRAAQTLESLGWKPQTSMEQIRCFIAFGEIKKLTAFGSEAVKPLIELLRDSASDKKIAAANVLGEIGDAAAFKPLQNLFRDADPFVRVAAIYALERAGCHDAVPAFTAALKDSARNVRLAAAGALGALGGSQAVEPLVALLNDQDWEIRRSVLESLGRLGDNRVASSVAKHLQDKDNEVREVAADTLGRVGDESIVEKLVFTMVDAHSGVRQAAARALTKIYPRWERSERVQRLLPEIQAQLKSHDISVQSAAASLLRRVGGNAAGGAGISLSSGREDAERSQNALLNMLREMLRDDDVDLRLAAAETIGQMKLAACIADLKTALAGSTSVVKMAAQNALEKLAAGATAAPSGSVTFLSQPVASTPMASSPVEAVLVCSSFGEVLHQWQCGDLAGSLALLEYILPQSEQLGRVMTLGEFKRLEILLPFARIVVVSAPECCVLLRLKSVGTASAVEPIATIPGVNESLKAHVTEWLRRTPSVRGVLMRGIRFADQTIVCDVDSRDITSAALEEAYGSVADAFQWLAAHQVPSTRLVWSYERIGLNCVRREDKTILGALTSAKPGELDFSGLNRQLAEFQSLKPA